MTAWTANIEGMAGEHRGVAKADDKAMQEPLNMDLYNRYRIQTAQAQGLICQVYIPKSVTVAASDTFTLTVKA